MRMFVALPLLFALAGCPSNGNCPVDTVSSASQCVPIRDLAAPPADDLAGLTSVCPTIPPGTGTHTPPCEPGVVCQYSTQGDDGGAGLHFSCQCMSNHQFLCLASH